MVVLEGGGALSSCNIGFVETGAGLYIVVDAPGRMPMEVECPLCEGVGSGNSRVLLDISAILCLTSLFITLLSIYHLLVLIMPRAKSTKSKTVTPEKEAWTETHDVSLSIRLWLISAGSSPRSHSTTPRHQTRHLCRSRAQWCG